MGQQENYQESIEWDPRLTLEEREARGPVQSAFGAGRADSGKAAIATAQGAAVIAEHVLMQVKEQAVWACLAEGRSIRATAEQLALKKSEVGRIAKELGRDGGLPRSRATMPPVGTQQDVLDLVRAAWGHK